MPVFAKVTPTDGQQANASALILMKGVCKTLNKHYPGYNWDVNIDVRGGVVDIKNLDISYRDGYREYLAVVQMDTKLKCIIKAGGEILERANAKRGTRTGDPVTYVEGATVQPINGIIV